MKIIKSIVKLLIVTLIISCGNDDVTPPTNLQNGITVNGNFIPTSNAYLILDRGVSPFENSFFFCLSDDKLINDSNYNILSSTNTTSVAVLHVDNLGVVSNLNQVNVNATSYILEKDNTAILENISMFSNTITTNGITYGIIDENSANNYLILNSGAGTFTITAITKDFVAKTGTISCSFTITDDNGIVITGNYSGSFTILNGDV